MKACTFSSGPSYPHEGHIPSRASSRRQNAAQDPGASPCNEAVNSVKLQLRWPVGASLTSGSLLFVSDCLAQSIERLSSNGRLQNEKQYFQATNERQEECGDAPARLSESEVSREETVKWTLQCCAIGQLNIVTCLVQVEFDGSPIRTKRQYFHHILSEHDVSRTARMAVYGFFFYGPILNFWFRNLDHLLPRKTVSTTFAKVALSQTTLNPALLAFVFAYNYAWTGRLPELQGTSALLLLHWFRFQC